MATISERRTENGKRHYQVKVRLKGYPPQAATFHRKKEAERWAQATEAALRERRYFKTAESERRTVGEVIARYLREILPTKRSGRSQRAQLFFWQQELGAVTLAALTPAAIAECRDRLARGESPSRKSASPATQVRYLAALSHAFTVAVREWGWLDDNPVRKVRRPTEPHGRVRFLSEEERTALLAACKRSRNPLLYPLVVLALATGARLGELLSLRWVDLDLVRGVARLARTKNGEARTLPLAEHALAILAARAAERRSDTSFVFPSVHGRTPASLRKPWERALNEAGIANFRFHDLRHTAASYLAMMGATPTDIAAVLGHKTLAMVKRYAHLSDQHVSQVVARMNESIFGSAP
ncbi:MAG TPA: site-specific integrase [Thermoanaerobaculia bacterium]|nr:site-specific integrase [Thermoanaerobaculia bacterium]